MYVYTQKIPAKAKIPLKIWLAFGITSLLVLMPLYVIHAQLSNTATITFSTDTRGNWEYTSGFHDNGTYFDEITSDKRESTGSGKDLVDTSIATTVKMEVFIADTKGAKFTASCSTPHFTGNPATDLACDEAAALKQNYPYTLGQTWQTVIAPVVTPTQTIATTTCVCP